MLGYSQIDEENITAELIDSIGRVYENQNMITMISMFNIEATRLRVMRKPFFLADIVELFQRNQLVAGCDVLVKNGVMGAVWIVMTRRKRVVIERKFSQRISI